MILLVIAVLSFSSLVVSLLAFRRYAMAMGWAAMAVFILTVIVGGISAARLYTIS